MEDISGLLGAVVVIAAIIISNIKRNSARNGNARKREHNPTARRVPTSGPVQKTVLKKAEVSSEGKDPCHDEMLKVSPRDDRFWEGSMNAVSEEGKDPCHEEQFSEINEVPGQSAVDSRPLLNMNPANLAQAFVLQEVLKRPVDRKTIG